VALESYAGGKILGFMNMCPIRYIICHNKLSSASRLNGQAVNVEARVPYILMLAKC
jgi:hypothetical protein